MKVIIAGCRDFNDFSFMKESIDNLVNLGKVNITEIVSGKAK